MADAATALMDPEPEEAPSRIVSERIALGDEIWLPDLEIVIMDGVGGEDDFVDDEDASETAEVIDSDPYVIDSCVVEVDDISDSEELGINELEEVVVLVDARAGSRPVTLRKRGISRYLHHH